MIKIKVIPRAKEQKIVKISENEFVAYLTEPPIKNRANKELIEVLSKYFRVPKSSIKIIRGSKSRIKIVEIE